MKNKDHSNQSEEWIPRPIKRVASALGNGIVHNGKLLWKHRASIGRASAQATLASAGAIKQGSFMAADASSHLLFSDTRKEKLQQKINGQAREYSSLMDSVVNSDDRFSDKDRLDIYMVGGLSLAELLEQKIEIPDDLTTAFERAFPDLAQYLTADQALRVAYSAQHNSLELAFMEAYPNLAKNQTLREAILQNENFELTSLVSGIKGKLFEIKYVEYLNAGNHLPMGYHARLADSPTQPKWDIQIVDDRGHVHEELQLKATDSLDYIQSALNKYPQIDVVVPEETFRHIALQNHSLLENVKDSGISLQDMENQIQDYITQVRGNGMHPAYNTDSTSSLDQDSLIWQDGTPQIDMGIPILSLAIIAFSEYRQETANIYQKSMSFGERAAKAYASYAAGALVISLLPSFWFLSFLPVMGVRAMLTRGQNKRRDYINMLKQYKANSKIIRRLKRQFTLKKMRYYIQESKKKTQSIFDKYIGKSKKS